MPRRNKRRKLAKTNGDPNPRDNEISGTNSCDTEFPSVYLVVGHQTSRPAYFVFAVNPFADGGESGTRIRIRHRMRLASLHAKHGMSFVPVRSQHGPWIVGVGGDSAHKGYDGPETVVWDATTQAVITGPKLAATKSYPVLLPVGGHRIYALSRSPSVKKEPDFVPWFEVLDLSQALVVDGRLVSCEWRALPRPPFFPWELTPRQYIVPPEVIVESYVAMGPCILVSVTGQTGTHMFHTDTERWLKLSYEDLPFTGGAVPHGSLFLGSSRADQQITGYDIRVLNTAASPRRCPSMSIVEFPIVTDIEEEDDPEERVVSDHGFCSFSCLSSFPTLGIQHPRERVVVRAYTSEEHFNSFGNLLVSNQRKQEYVIRDSLRGLTWPCLEAVISL